MGTLYVLTCAPGPLWQDSGLFQYRIWHNDIEGKLGLAFGTSVCIAWWVYWLNMYLWENLPDGLI